MTKKYLPGVIITLTLGFIVTILLMNNAQNTPTQKSQNTKSSHDAHRTRKTEPDLKNQHNIETNPDRYDGALLTKSLEEGYIPTQEIGELGSREGKIITSVPMVYPKTKYEYLPDSPLIKFTDDMIWQEGDEYRVIKDAAQAQANTIQEASIALSVSEYVNNGKIDGYLLVEVPGDTLFAKLGIVSGDVILDINGGKPDMEPMALHFVNMVALHGSSTIKIEHAGKERTIVIRAAY